MSSGWKTKSSARSRCIEQKLGVKVNCFAVPYGFYNDHVKEVAMKAGYEAMFTVYGQQLTLRFAAGLVRPVHH